MVNSLANLAYALLLGVTTLPQTNAPTQANWGFDLGGMDLSVKPGDDFFSFANGRWFARTQIPADKSKFGLADGLVDTARQQVRVIVESSKGEPDTEAGKIKNFYHAFMDEARVESLDDQPIRAGLAQISKVSTRRDLARMMGGSHSRMGGSYFHLGVFPSEREPTHYSLYVYQGGLSMPNRQYYLSEEFEDKKSAFKAYVAQMLGMVHWSNSKAQANAIVSMESKIAEASWNNALLRADDREKHPIELATLEKKAPGFYWAAWLEGAGIRNPGPLTVRQLAAFPKIAKIFANTPLATLKSWEAFCLIDEMAPYLSRRFEQASFAFQEKVLLGQPEDVPRWVRGVDLVSGCLGGAVGKLYVAKYFPASSKSAIESLALEIKVAFRKRIENVSWMSAATKARALNKLDELGMKIGYPSKWRDYSALAVDPNDLVGDVNRTGAFEWNRSLRKLTSKVDPEDWGETPQTVNAYYDEKRNEIVFPAAILQPPFFDPKADMAVNYGAIGGVIGHEMTHGFDDQGRKSDAKGVLTDWWQPEDSGKFKAQSEKLQALVDAYVVAPDVHVDGLLTMTENIADIGGMLLAVDAYRASLHGQEAPVLDGFTGLQRVFLGWAQMLRTKFRQEAMMDEVTGDEHSPDQFRVIGPMRNVDAWYEAWHIGAGDKYYLAPKDRVHIW